MTPDLSLLTERIRLNLVSHSKAQGCPAMLILARVSKEGWRKEKENCPSVFVGMHQCIYVHVIHTMPCKSTVCNTTDMCAAKKFAFTEERGLLINDAYWSSQTVVGGLQSTVGGL